MKKTKYNTQNMTNKTWQTKMAPKERLSDTQNCYSFNSL